LAEIPQTFVNLLANHVKVFVVQKIEKKQNILWGGGCEANSRTAKEAPL